MSFFKKAQTNLARVKQVAMAKMGQAESTVDVQFNQEEAKFKEQFKKMKKLSNYIQGYQTAIRDLHTAQNGMSQMLLEQYEPHHKMFQVATQLNEKTAQDLEQLRQRLDQYVAENFHQPLSQYLGQYKQIEERIAERNKRLVDMDRYRLEVKSLMERGQSDPQRLQITNQKAEAKTHEYQSLNDELMRDIPRLLDDRSAYFDSLFANLVDAQLQYLRDAANVLSSLEGGLLGVNRTDFQKHQQVITDDSMSSASPGNAGNAPPPQQQQQQQQQQRQQQQQQQQYQQPQQMQQQQAPPQQQYQQQPPMQQQFQQPMQQQAPQQQMQQQAAPMQQQQQAPPGYGAPSGGAKAQALYPFQGQDNTELSFQFNDVITVLRQGGEWWEGELNGARGLFPSNYVKLM